MQLSLADDEKIARQNRVPAGNKFETSSQSSVTKKKYSSKALREKSLPGSPVTRKNPAPARAIYCGPDAPGTGIRGRHFPGMQAGKRRRYEDPQR
jgi:hypothetical protein